MPVYKDEKKGTFLVRFKTKDMLGKVKEVHKRGFKTKKEALAWEFEYKMRRKGSPKMSFASFVNEIYLPSNKPRLKLSTWLTKKNLLELHILPCFGDMALDSIAPAHVIAWQNEMVQSKKRTNGKPFSSAYLKSMNKELTAVFSFAVDYYGLADNPSKKVKLMGRGERIEMKFWTLDQYRRFEEAIRENPTLHCVFQVLYWTGLRKGELMALTFDDVDLEKGTLTVNKTFNHLGGKDIVTTPKTKQSFRTVTIPDFLVDEIREYKERIYKPCGSDRMFPICKSTIGTWLKRGTEKAGLPKIRVHDLRHSHVSLLIDRGFPVLSIAKRVGHSSLDITYMYAHMFPNVQENMAKALDVIAKGECGSNVGDTVEDEGEA